jgi:NAD(P)-dependent dehydrogenase (short-subunit alcohol dehydrogenase family)
MSEKRIALVTGSNRGIGFEICRQLAEHGLKVILTARDKAKGEQAAKKLKTEGLDVGFELLEVGNKDSTKQLANSISNKYGALDILINNAGILPNSGNIETADIDEVKKVFDTNFFGAMMLIQEVLPLLKKSNDGRIINISSGMGAFNEGGSGYLAYRTSKTAINGLTKVVANDLINTNIKVNSMCPGWVQTDMGGIGAPRTVEQGADTAFWLATSNEVGNGKFYRDRKEIKW